MSILSTTVTYTVTVIYTVLRRFLPWLALALALLACNLQQSAGDQPTAVPGTVVFQDDFSDPASGWNRVDAPSGATDYADGMYRIWINEPNLDVWARPGLKFADVRIEVNAIKVEGERDNRFGLICRLTQTNNFYVFLISSDGYYGIGKVVNGQFWLIGAERLQASPHIYTGSATNHIQAECKGSSLILSVNQKKLAEVKDNELRRGDVGLFAGTYATPGVDIRFDDFIVVNLGAR